MKVIICHANLNWQPFCHINVCTYRYSNAFEELSYWQTFQYSTSLNPEVYTWSILLHHYTAAFVQLTPIQYRVPLCTLWLSSSTARL